MDAITNFAVEIGVMFAVFIAITVMAVISRGRSALTWSTSLKKSAFTNFVISKFNGVVTGFVFIMLIPVNKAYDAVGFPQVSEEFWATIPTPLTWLALLFVYDLSLYWIHRWMHSGWLWPVHAVHHSDTDLHFLSWSRGHALEHGFMMACLIISSTWMGLEIEAIFGLALIKGLHQYYVHSNIDWNHGPLKMLLVSPQFHRWHHADDEAAWDKNFASIFPFLDKIFGTYYYPGTAVNTPTGFEGTPGHDIVELIFYPFKEWTRMIKAKFAKTEPVAPLVDAAE